MKLSESELEKRGNELELDVYDVPSCYVAVHTLHNHASDFFNDVLDHFDLTYFCPGEPEARDDERDIVIPLSNPDKTELRTDGEIEAEMAEGPTLPVDLFYARLRVRQAKDILENGWQYGLGVPRGGK